MELSVCAHKATVWTFFIAMFVEHFFLLISSANKIVVKYCGYKRIQTVKLSLIAFIPCHIQHLATFSCCHCSL